VQLGYSSANSDETRRAGVPIARSPTSFDPNRPSLCGEKGVGGAARDGCADLAVTCLAKLACW
jgi:hypothetical protein